MREFFVCMTALVFVLSGCSMSQVHKREVDPKTKVVTELRVYHSTLFKDTEYSGLSITKLDDGSYEASLGKSTSITRLSAKDIARLVSALATNDAATVLGLLAQ